MRYAFGALVTLAWAAAVALTATRAEAAEAPHPAKVPEVPSAVISAYSTLGIDFVVGTISYLVDAQKTFVDAPTAQTIGAANARLIESYHDSMRDARFGASQFHGFMNVAIVAGTVGGSSTGIGAVVAIPAGIAAAKLNDMARDYLVANTQARASAALDVGLTKMTADQRQTMDSLLKAGKYEEAKAHFEKSTGALSKMRQKLAGDTEAETLLDKAMAAAMAQGSVAAIRTAGAALDKVGNFEDEFVNYTRKFADFGRKTDAALTKLEASTVELSGQIKEVQGQVADLARSTNANGIQISLIQQMLFDQQPPSIKLAMLEGGALSGLSDGQRETLTKALKIQVKQQEIVGTVSAVVGYARDLNTIMGAFGVSDPGLQRAIAHGNVAAQALTQAFSGNYLGAIASVAGLFGGGGAQPDPMAQHMQTIMAAFDGVNKRLEAVMALQRETLQAILVLSNNLNVLRRETHARFDRVDFELAQLRLGQKQLIWQPLADCESAFSHQDADLVGQPHVNGKSRYDKVNRRFYSFETLRDYVNSHGDKAYKCAEYLNGIFTTFRNPDAIAGNPLSLAFAEGKLGAEAGVPDDPPVNKPAPPVEPQPGAMTLIEYDMPALAYYKSRLYEPSLRVFQSGWLTGLATNPGWGGLANAYAMLTRPSANVRSLHQRMEALATTSTATPSKPCEGPRSLLGRRLQDYLCSDTTVYLEKPDDAVALAAADDLAARRAVALLGNPILRDQVGQLMEYALFVAAPRDLVRGNGAQAPYTLMELAESGRDPLGRNLLTRALAVVDVAIAQQAMLYGDMTAYFVADLLWDKQRQRFRKEPLKAAEKGVFEDAQRLLNNANNPWLRRNVAMIILKRSQRNCDARDVGDRCQQNNLLYELALDRFFAVKDGSYAPIDDSTQAAAELTLRQAFDLHADARFLVRDKTRPADVVGSVPRTLVLSLDGYELPLPSRSDWRQGALSYPPLMHDRLADRERVGSRLAGYAALDRLDAVQRRVLLTLLANQPVQ